MSPPDVVTVRGFLADGDTGAGVGGLRVELWSGNGEGPELVAAGQSDGAGLFHFHVPPDRLPDRHAGHPVDIELRVLDEGRLLASELRELPVEGSPESIDIDILAPDDDEEALRSELAIPDRYEVIGQVKGTLPEESSVQAVLSTLDDGALDEQAVAHGTVNAEGWYRMEFERPPRSIESSDTSLIVRLFDPGGEQLAQSAPVLAPERRTRLDLRPRRVWAGPSEYALIEGEIARELVSGVVGLESADEAVLEQVAEWIDVDADRLVLFQQARALEAETGLPGPIFYALGRNGMPVAPEDLLDVPIHELHTTIAESAANGIIDPSLADNLGPLVDRLAEQVVERAIRPDREATGAGLGEIIAAADLPADAIERVLRKYQARHGSALDFWDSFTEEEGLAEELGDETVQEVELAVRLGSLLGPDPPLLHRMHELRREGRWQKPADLSAFTFDEWCELLEDIEAGNAEDAEDPEDDEDAEERIEERAEAILDTLEETYRSAFIERRLIETEELSPAARRLLDRVPGHDFVHNSIRERIASEPAVLEGMDEAEADAAMAQVEAVERVSRVTDRADEVAVLVGTGIESAMEIASMSRRQFNEVYGEAVGGRAQASRIHAQAQQAAAGAKFAAIRMLQAQQHMPLVLGAAAPAPAVKGVPDARTLFQAAVGFCDCEHCGSVYSPAAYYVDLLRYLNVTSPDRLDQLEVRLKNRTAPAVVAQVRAKLARYQPLDVLLARRPDLADLPLSCENTLTSLPYIDLVNELLEAFITGGSAAFDTGKTPADVLRAVPQNISRAAYDKLRQAVHPIALPYHQPLALGRAYLGHLGVTRHELLRTLGRGDAIREALVAESLAMSPEEFAMVASPPPELWRHFGFASADAGGVPFVAALKHLPTFLAATDVTFKNLIELVSTRFVNADNQLLLETPAPDCNPETIRLTGLDEARLSRMLRLIRLQRRLGWSFADLDRALVAFSAADLDASILEKLTVAQDLAKTLDRPLAELLVLWAPIDTAGKDNQFDRLFTTRAVMWRTEDERTFQLRPDRLELAETGGSLEAVASALLAGLRITSEELALIRALQARRGAEPRLDLAGLSAVYRVVVLARALQLRIQALDLILRLVTPDADPFRPGDPAATRRFVEIVREIQASDFTPERLAYLFRHEWEPRRDPGPLAAQVEAVLGSIRRGLSDAFAETSHPGDATGGTLRQKLAALLDPPLLDPALEVLDPRTPLTPQRRREFFDRHLAKIFPDPAGAAAHLLEGAPAPRPVPVAPVAPVAPGTASPVAAAPASPTAPATAAPQPAVSRAAEPPAASDPFAWIANEPSPPAVTQPGAPIATAPATATAEPSSPASSEPAAIPAAAAPATEAAPAGGAPAAPQAQAAPQAPATTPAKPRDALEVRWRTNIDFVLEHLLPQLRARQLRGAVIQALSDTLGLTIPGTARLLGVVLRSRRAAGEPLLNDFLAMLGTGLTGAYYGNPELRGEPAVVRTDPELTFAWAGAAPAEGVPGGRFSVRWSGHVLAKTKAAHTFYVRTDGAVRLVVKVDGAERVLIDQPAAAGKIVEHTSDPVPLDPGRLTEIKLDYRNQGGPATLSLQFGTGPAAKQPLPATSLYPSSGLSSFEPVEQSYRRLHKAALIVSGFGITDEQLEWLTGEPPFLDLDALPMAAATDADAFALFGRWRQLAALYALRKKLPRSNTDLFEVFRASTMPEAIDRLVLATGWDRAAVEAFVGPDGLAVQSAAALRPSSEPGTESVIVRLARAMEVQRRVGVAPATLHAWANATPDADGATAIVQAVKARYDEKRWLEVAGSLNDPLRAERRDALVAYLLPRMRDLGVNNRNQLFEYFLIDVDMNPCMLTSRVRQATGAVQTFFQRALMNLEPKVPPRIIDENDWKWLKNYRVWEANRKIFLYPENWIEPELRDDKSPLFQELERSILQQEIKNENVESAFADYLEGLDEIARLDVRGVWLEDRQTLLRASARQKPGALRAGVPVPPRSPWDGTYHVFARTFNAPHVWYYRRLEGGRTWTAWEKIDADIEGEHLVPVIFNRRMYLFWTMFREVSKTPPPMDRKKEGPPPTLGKDWEINLAYSVYDRGRWSRKRMSSGGILDFGTFTTLPVGKFTPNVGGSHVLSPAHYTLRAQVAGAADLPQLHLYVYSRRVERVNKDRAGNPEVTLSAAQVDFVGRFDLNGCNGALVPVKRQFIRPPVVESPVRAVGRVAGKGKRRGGRGAVKAAIGVRAVGRVRAFSVAGGGLVNAPSGYEVSGMSYSAGKRGGALLALPTGDARGLAVALPQMRNTRRDANIVPVINPADPAQSKLYAFFFQDSFRSYFARPLYTDWRPPTLVAIPLRTRFAAPARFSPRPAPKRAAKPRRGLFGRREELEDILVLPPEAQDAWEDEQDEAWHPDDAAEARPKRTRKAAPRPKAARPTPARPAPARPAPAKRPAGPARRVAALAARPVARRVQVTKAGYHEQKLQLTPFEHPDTCHFIRKLKAQGIEGLLDFATTRPRVGKDHQLDAAGKWVLRGPTWFQRHYGIGPLIHNQGLPHLDVAFENDHPYAAYNWELFFHAPLQVAVRLAKEGRHEEAQRWFHFIFDPTTDSSSPSPQRYWRFAPFYENNEYDSARELMHLLSYSGKDSELIRRQAQVRDQLSAWWEKPFSPHVIARLRIAAYQKAVLMKYIDNLVEWGDKLFRRDTMETIQEATQIYILAANILGPRPEKIPPIVSREPLTFQKMRHQLDLFSNLEVRLENLQVRRPFRINARPDTGGATAVLGMVTQYFCTPPNPQLDKYWDTVADRLFKIRNCMNIQGIVRQLALFDPPIDPGLLVRAAAAGVDLGSVIASLNAPPPHYRFRFLLARATRLAEEIRSFGAMTLRVLERKDAEGLASLRASGETALLDAVREIRKKQCKQVEEALAELALERDHVDMQARHITQQMQQLMNAPEQAQQASLTAAKVVEGVAEGVDLVSKVMHAIPEFQTGAAGGFSSPFVTLQLGGQMLGDIAAAFASSFEKVAAKHETEAEMAGTQAEYQRRRDEWQHELELLAKEKAQVEKHIAETQIKLDICGAELRRHDLEVENSRKVGLYLRDKYTNEQLYGWMLGQLSGVYFQAYKVSFDAAQQAERAFRFERGEPSSSFIEFSYWDSLKKGMFAGERLLIDLRRMEAAYVEGDRRGLEVTRHISLREEYPLKWVELLATGRCQVEVSEALFDGDFPGHYFRRVKTVSLTVTGALKPYTNVNCTLTLLENRIRTDANASGTYAQAADADDSRFLVNLAPVQAVATSKPEADAGVFHLRFDDERYLPFEGAGAVSTWRIDLQQADNAVDLARLGDIVLTLAYTARTGGAALEAAARADREKGLARGGIKPEAHHVLSVKRDLPAVWKKLEEAAAGQEIESPFPLEPDRFSGRYRGLDLRIERVTVFAHARGTLAPDALRLRLDPPKGSGTPLAGWTSPWPRSRTVRGGAEVSGPPGTWKLAAGATGGKVPDLVDDLVFVFELRARKS